MPYKYHEPHRHHIKKQAIFRRDWSQYNASLKERGSMTIWLSHDVIENWYEKDRIYDGTGTPNLYSDMAVLTVHEIRQVFKLPLRQCEGLINSIFKLMKIDLECPSYSVMLKRLKKLNLKQPCYRKSHCSCDDIKIIAIDSSGLKCFGHEEWHTEKYQLTSKKQWKKLHLVVDQNQIIQSTILSDSHVQDQSVVKNLVAPIKEKVKHITADTAYDNNPTYQVLEKQFSAADIVIPPQKGSLYQKKNEYFRNRNIEEIKLYGRMGWQKRRDYGKRNQSELAIQRYKRILGNKLHARDFARQQQEAIIGCSILNKMMSITIGKIHSKF
jgi:DDE family transposase